MGTFQPNHRNIENEVQQKLGNVPVEQRINDPDAKKRMYALGEYSKSHRIKDDGMVARVYFDTWSELRRQNVADDRIGDLFQAGKNKLSVPIVNEEDVSWAG